jgi:hypothetical protein
MPLALETTDGRIDALQKHSIPAPRHPYSECPKKRGCRRLNRRTALQNDPEPFHWLRLHSRDKAGMSAALQNNRAQKLSLTPYTARHQQHAMMEFGMRLA